MIDGGTGIAVAPAAANVTIEGFTIETEGAGTPIHTEGSDVDKLKIQANVIESAGVGVWLEAGGKETSISLNTVSGEEAGIRLDGPGHVDLEIKNDRFTGPPGFPGVLAEDGTAIAGFRLEGSGFATARIAASVTDGEILTNTIEPPAGGVGLSADLHESLVRGNTFRGNGEASCLELLGSPGGLTRSSETRVSGNEFSGCTPYAIQLGPEVEGIHVTHNTFPGSYDAVATDDSVAWDVTGKGNRVFGNRLVELLHLGVDNKAGGVLDARDNWWGCNDGPGGPGCGRVSAGVDALPPVTLTAEASEIAEDAWMTPLSAVAPGERVAIIAYLKNDDGSDALSVDTVGRYAHFSSPRGTFTSQSSSWQNARAAVGFTAGPQPGPAEIEVTMDNQRVTVPLTITGSSPSPSPTRPPFVPRTQRTGLPLPAGPVPHTRPATRPKVRLRPRLLALSGRRHVLGRISCAASACKTGRRSAVVEIGGRRFRAKLRAPRHLPAAGYGQIRVILTKRAFRRLSRHGTGVLTVRIRAAGANRATTSVVRSFKIKWRSRHR